MSADIVVIIILSILGLCAHGSRHHPWMEWVLRVIYSFALVAEGYTALFGYTQHPESVTPWTTGITAVMALFTGMLLFRPGRELISYFLTALNQIIGGGLITQLRNPPRLTYVAAGTGSALSLTPDVTPTSTPVAPPLPNDSAKGTAADSSIGVAPTDSPAAASTVAPDATATASTESGIVTPTDAMVTASAESSTVTPTDTMAIASAQSSTVTPSDSTAAATESSTATPTDTTAGVGAVPAESAPAGTSNSAVTNSEIPIAGSPASTAAIGATAGANAVSRGPVWQAMFSDRIFMKDSVPHMNGLWIYVTVLGSLLASINLDNFKFPSIQFPFPVPMDSLISYNFLGLVLLAMCGCGIFVARKPKEVLKRLGIVKPEGWHIGVAILCVPATFIYDYIWSLFTGDASGVGSKLATYNAGTFSTTGGAGGAAILAVLTGTCAGIGEETLIRGALQAVFGILPAAFLHGALHGQFQHAPILILQVAGWSTLMGIVRKYTNTTTTIITHGTFNFITTFLFAFNP